MAQDARGDQCDICSRTLDAIDLINPRCLISKEHKVSRRSTAHMYIKLDALQPKIEDWIKQAYKAGKWSQNAVINSEGELIDARLNQGLRPSPVTRDLTWGVPVPIDEEDKFEMKGKVFCMLHLLLRIGSVLIHIQMFGCVYLRAIPFNDLM